MNEPQHDEQAFEAYLRGESTLSHLYRQTMASQPPAALDAAVLTAARQAVYLHPQRVWWRRWIVPVSVAAVVVLSLSMVTWWWEEISTGLTDARHPNPAQTHAPAAPQAPQDLQPAREPTPHTPMAPVMPTPPSETRAPHRQDSYRHSESDRRQRASGFAEEPVSTEQREEKKVGGQEESPLPPEEWLQQIATLRRQGQIAEAEASLAAFKRQYPSYPLEKWKGEER
jgi:hypothetical protein